MLAISSFSVSLWPWDGGMRSGLESKSFFFLKSYQAFNSPAVSDLTFRLKLFNSKLIVFFE
jgi:hypothetical protein